MTWQNVQVLLLRPDPASQVRQNPLVLSQVRQPKQAVQVVAVPPVEKVSFVQIWQVLLFSIYPGLQDEHEPSVAEQAAQLGQGWQAWLLFAGLKVAFAQEMQVLLKVSRPVPAGQVRQLPFWASQV